jgi:hypothetical protein
LKKCAYGLADAPRRWFLRIREELLKLGATPSAYDNGIYLFYDDDTHYGSIVLYVDDILWAGINDRLDIVILKLKSTFEVSHEETDAFNYVGIHIRQGDGSVTLDQSTYIESVPLIPDSLENLHTELTNEKVTLLRGAVGRMNWIANMTRPNISFVVSKVSSNIKTATGDDIKEINKLIRYVKSTQGATIKFPALDIASTRVLVYADSSFNNLDNGSSQGGQIVFLKDGSDRACPISWKSQKVRKELLALRLQLNVFLSQMERTRQRSSQS